MSPLAATSRDAAASGLSRDWWMRALAAHERPGALPPADGPQPTNPGGWRPGTPAAACGHGSQPGLERGTPGVGGGRPSRPGWADVVERAVATARPPRELPAMGAWQDAFAIPLRPFLSGARDGLAAAAWGFLSPADADPMAVADTFTAVLGRQLAQLAVRTMVHELRLAHDQGRLAGADGQARFSDFIRRLCEPAGLAALFGRYPVLARLLGTASLRATQAGQELLTRFSADRPAVIGSLLGGADPGPAIAVEPGLGDLHRQGRSVAVVTFADGRKVVYKPRSLTAHALFGDVAGWLSRRVPQASLRTARVLLRPRYGWQEFVAPQALPSPAAANDFYRREGVLLAALHALCAVDVHCENVVACGDQPVLIDLETLFHPVLPYPHLAGDDPAAGARAASVQRTSLLPCLSVGERGQADVSGMGGDGSSICAEGMLDWEPPATDRTRLIRRAAPRGPARTAGPAGAAGTNPRNRPCQDGRPAEPADYETVVLEGFRLGYNAIAADRAGFTRLIESWADTETRVVVRPSRGYARLLEQSTAPDLLRDGRDRDRALEVLHQASAANPLWRRLAPHEIADLWTGDIPLVTGRPTARGLWTSAGQYLPGLLERPALSGALEKIAAMGDVDRRDQEWIISASLATRRETGGHRGAVPARHPVAALAALPGAPAGRPPAATPSAPAFPAPAPPAATGTEPPAATGTGPEPGPGPGTGTGAALAVAAPPCPTAVAPAPWRPVAGTVAASPAAASPAAARNVTASTVMASTVAASTVAASTAAASPVVASTVAASTVAASTVAGPVAAGPVTAGAVAAGPVAAGPVAPGPVAAGPVAPGPVAAGPVAAGPVAAGAVAAGAVGVGISPARQPLTGSAAPAATPARLLATACGLADRIVARGMSVPGREAGGSAARHGLGGDGPADGTPARRGPARSGDPPGAPGSDVHRQDRPRVNWLGLQPVEGTQWMVLPMGAGLADGYPGVALFLAQLARLTGVARYAEVARSAVSPLPGLLGVLDVRPDLLTTVGCGVAEGLAGISYALARMSTLLDDPALGEWAETAVRLTGRLVATPPGTAQTAVHPAAGAPATGGMAAGGPDLPPGWLDGLAGCLAAMTAVHAELGLPAAAAVARACADQLAVLSEQTGGQCVTALEPVAPGFAAGPAGVGWALARFGANTADPAYQEAGRRAVWGAVDPVAGSGADGSPGWCRGTAGLLVARSCLGDTELHRESCLLTRRPVLDDLSLCHGEAGITEALTMLAPAQPPSGPPAATPGGQPPPWRHRAGLIVDAVDRHARFCGTPGGMPTPGLLRGLAGIGYGLLRAGFTERVPSVLFLEPTPASSAGGGPGQHGPRQHGSDQHGADQHGLA